MPVDITNIIGLRNRTDAFKFAKRKLYIEQDIPRWLSFPKTVKGHNFDFASWIYNHVSDPFTHKCYG